MSWTDVATALVRHYSIHEGFWRVTVEFGESAGVNANWQGHVRPAVVVPVLSLMLTKVDVLNELSVDAEKVNPRNRIIRPGFPEFTPTRH